MKKPIQNFSKGWGEVAGIQSPEVIRRFSGISSLDRFSIQDEFMVMNKNITAKEFPTAAVRKGSRSLGSTSGKTNGMMVFKEKELHAITNGNWRKWNGSTWDSLLSGLSATAKPTFTNFKGNFSDFCLLVANGVDTVRKYDGTSVTVLSAPAGLNFICSHDNRVYGAVKNALHYSALRKADDWNTVDQSGQIWIEAGGGEDISCLVAGTGHVVAFTKHSTHELYGTKPANYQLQTISEEIGCVSHQSAKQVGTTLYFLSHDGIYRYAGGAVPKKDFSATVQKIVDRINPEAWDSVVAGTDSDRYYISLPIDGATKPNITLEYDPTTQTWNVWDFGKVPTAYALVKEKMYVGFEESMIVEMGGTLDDGLPIPYKLETKPFNGGSLASDKRLYKLWLVADVPVGATLNVYLSNSDKGEDWTLLKSIVPKSAVQTEPIFIPVTSSFFNKWVRLKIEGVGAVVIHELTRQSRSFRFGMGGV